ncbi:ribose 5-phosphate isomerase B [Helicobacter didelphidarum]|uniref:Ribose 5-phosphate isomerase B n=1 Tax=Helicobacter didelphidarum TaxID=2040648 RepID=A0A3D8IQM0_9HELI|nr:ribose 5-phosphate isomerase B [Helicobacter didelphidarum]RDU67578.1 ribose 5-phosphate isomerase B [Helicobacter didelphidarum]
MLFIANDHAGINLKYMIVEYCHRNNIIFEDLGVSLPESVDYPDIADILCEKVKKDIKSRGILICGTGIGMSIAANQHSNIRAALCTDTFMAKFARRHNNANVLCLGERVLGPGLAEAIVEVFLQESFEGGRHSKRIEKLITIKGEI